MKTTLLALLGVSLLATSTGCGLPYRGGEVIQVEVPNTLRDSRVVNTVHPLPVPALRKAAR